MDNKQSINILYKFFVLVEMTKNTYESVVHFNLTDLDVIKNGKMSISLWYIIKTQRSLIFHCGNLIKKKEAKMYYFHSELSVIKNPKKDIFYYTSVLAVFTIYDFYMFMYYYVGVAFCLVCLYYLCINMLVWSFVSAVCTFYIL